ncbi:hypothetical protein V8F20_002827 [Naviculisporaceae sp. PSN 640]
MPSLAAFLVRTAQHVLGSLGLPIILGWLSFREKLTERRKDRKRKTCARAFPLIPGMSFLLGLGIFGRGCQ